MENRKLYIWHKAPVKIMRWKDWVKMAEPGVYLVEEMLGPYGKRGKFSYMVLVIRPKPDLEVRMTVPESLLINIVNSLLNDDANLEGTKSNWMHMVLYGYLLYYELRADGSDGFFFEKTEIEKVEDQDDMAWGWRYDAYDNGFRRGWRLTRGLIHLSKSMNKSSSENETESSSESETESFSESETESLP